MGKTLVHVYIKAHDSRLLRLWNKISWIVSLTLLWSVDLFRRKEFELAHDSYFLLVFRGDVTVNKA